MLLEGMRGVKREAVLGNVASSKIGAQRTNDLVGNSRHPEIQKYETLRCEDPRSSTVHLHECTKKYFPLLSVCSSFYVRRREGSGPLLSPVSP